MINRRRFFALAGAIASGRFFARGARLPADGTPPPGRFPSPGRSRARQSASSYFGWESIAEGVRVATGGGGTSLVLGSGSESLLVDCKGYGLGDTLRREVEEDGRSLVAAVNTHHHAAQSGGNVAFTADIPLLAHRRAGPRIVSAVGGVLEALGEDPEGGIIRRRRQQISDGAHSSDGARRALEEFDAHVSGVDSLVPGNFGPTAVFSDTHQIRVGSIDVELHHFGRAHTDNDVVVWTPDRGVAHVGNLAYIDSHPYVDAPRGGSIRGWQQCLRRTMELLGAEAVVVPSDGGLLATVHDLDAQNTYFDSINELAQSAIDAGMSREETVDFIPSTGMGRFASLARPELLPVNLGIAYDELGGR